jgi:hypothetical protein
MEHNPYEPPSSPSEGAFPSYRPRLAGATIYEFDEFENATISRLGRRSKTWGVLCIVGGVLGILAMLAATISLFAVPDGMPAELQVFMGMFMLFVVVIFGISIFEGTLYLGAGKSLTLVVETEGEDVEHAVAATEKLGRAIWLEFWLKIAGVALALVLVIVGLVAAAANG